MDQVFGMELESKRNYLQMDFFKKTSSIRKINNSKALLRGNGNKM